MKLQLIRNDLQSVFKASDNILARYETEKNQVPERIKGQATIAVLRDMTNHKSFFSVCAVDELKKMCDVDISSEHNELFHSLHCVHWDQMEEETREYLVAVLIEYFKPVLSTSFAEYDVTG